MKHRTETEVMTRSSDPLGKLFRRLPAAPISAGALILIASSVIDFMLYKANPAFGAALLSDEADLLFRLELPILTGYYVWSHTGVNDLLNRIRHRGMFAAGKVVDEVEARICRLSSTRIIPMIALGLALSYTVYHGLSEIERNKEEISDLVEECPDPSVSSLMGKHPSIVFWRAPFWAMTFYMSVITLWTMLMAFSYIQKAFDRGEPRPNLFHPDGCAGFSVLGNFVASLSIPLGLAGFYLGFFVVSQLPDLKADAVLGSIIYIGGVPFVLFAPMYPVRTAVNRARNLAYEKLDGRYRDLLSRSLDGRTGGSPEDEVALPKKADLDETAEALREISGWPIESKTLNAYKAAVAAPWVVSIAKSILAGTGLLE